MSPLDLSTAKVPLLPSAAYVAYFVNMTDYSFISPATFDASHPIELPAVTLPEFTLVHFAPVLSNGWVVLGEAQKWVPVSPKRVQQVTVVGEDVELTVNAIVGEEVVVDFAILKDGRWVSSTVPCTAASSLLILSTSSINPCREL
jgi:hypothetical protein